MPNIAAVLKSEIGRLARKELLSETEGLMKTVAAQSSDLAALKRRVQSLEKALKVAAREATPAKPYAGTCAAEKEAGQCRFRAGGMAANRKRLGLSAADFRLPVGSTGQSVCAWEAGKSKPRGKNLAAIAGLRGIGRREVAKKLAELKQS